MVFTKERGSGGEHTGESRSGSEKRRQNRKMTFRVDDAEKAAIESAAQREGLTPGSYIRSRTLSRPTTRAVRRAPVETQQLAQLLGMLGAVGGAVETLAKKHGGAEAALDAETRETMALFRETAIAILKALGKRPALHGGRGP